MQNIFVLMQNRNIGRPTNQSSKHATADLVKFW